MQKALTQMNIRLTEVLNDITGVSGLKMIEAIVAGERDANKLLELCVSQLQKKKGEQIVKSLQGHYRSEHIFALKQALNTWHYYNSLITECDKEIEIQLEKMTKDKEDKDSGNPHKSIRYNRPQIEGLHKSLLKLSDGKDPINIAGITDYSLLQIMSEVGTDMSHWSTEKYFTS